MKIYAPFDRAETWHRTALGDTEVTWKITDSGEARVMFLQPGEAYPAGEYPTLQEARSQLPEHEKLWEVVAAELLANLTAGPDSPARRQHREFFGHAY